MPSRKKPSVRTRVLVGGAALAAVGAGVVGTVAASAADSPAATPVAVAARGGELTRSTHLSLDAAVKAARAAVEAAEKDGRQVSVAVVDRNGNTLVTLRGDGAGPQSYESAERKAFTAVSWNAPTSELAGRLAQAPNLKDIPGTLFLAGGTPVTAQGAPVAGIGVAGAPSGDLDERYARAGAAVLGR
ncbi:heme-binding protein [Streptomyces sp. SID486]|uniref:GlcG/HbpS family heme-binding protein n=1 Tax=unclassified Streptomyces TaxID=2593676 RepID=UPI00136BE063|nr:heme-binding protein [Streptomyces sp. SID486]MYW14387.1 heme-binding protein [Streptomyces sp. SID2955]MYX98127.1 heme-binding protein [Streptomyces sp. SID486]